MSAVRFEYQIPVQEYVAAQILYHKTKGRSHWRNSVIFWIILGAILIVITFNARPPDWAAYNDSPVLALVLLALVGVWWIWGGIRVLFPARYFRRAYESFEFAGKSFQAELDESGFQSLGEFLEWRAKWPGVSLKAEDGRILLFVAGGTLFIFGKKFLTTEPQDEIRRLGGLTKVCVWTWGRQHHWAVSSGCASDPNPIGNWMRT